MRSDLDAVRKAMHGLEQRQLEIYEVVSRRAHEPRALAIVCFVCVLVCIGCAIVGVR